MAAPYQKREVAVPYQKRELAVPYQKQEVAVPYQKRELTVPYQKQEVAVPYQKREGAVCFRKVHFDQAKEWRRCLRLREQQSPKNLALVKELGLRLKVVKRRAAQRS